MHLIPLAVHDVGRNTVAFRAITVDGAPFTFLQAQHACPRTLDVAAANTRPGTQYLVVEVPNDAAVCGN